MRVFCVISFILVVCVHTNHRRLSARLRDYTHIIVPLKNMIPLRIVAAQIDNPEEAITPPSPRPPSLRACTCAAAVERNFLLKQPNAASTHTDACKNLAALMMCVRGAPPTTTWGTRCCPAGGARACVPSVNIYFENKNMFKHTSITKQTDERDTFLSLRVVHQHRRRGGVRPQKTL